MFDFFKAVSDEIHGIDSVKSELELKKLRQEKKQNDEHLLSKSTRGVIIACVILYMILSIFLLINCVRTLSYIFIVKSLIAIGVMIYSIIQLTLKGKAGEKKAIIVLATYILIIIAILSISGSF